MTAPDARLHACCLELFCFSICGRAFQLRRSCCHWLRTKAPRASSFLLRSVPAADGQVVLWSPPIFRLPANGKSSGCGETPLHDAAPRLAFVIHRKHRTFLLQTLPLASSELGRKVRAYTILVAEMVFEKVPRGGPLLSTHRVPKPERFDPKP